MKTGGLKTVLNTLPAVSLLGSVTACGNKDIIETCDEPQAYQSVVAGKRIEVPEGLDPLDEFREMPIPEASSEPRPPGSKCVESPPSIGSGN